MEIGVGLCDWMVLEVFDGYYIEKVDIFLFGVIFFVIFQWDYISINGKCFYGVFKRVCDLGKVGFGYVMVKYNLCKI